MAFIRAFLNRMFGRSTDETDDTVLYPSDPAPEVVQAPAPTAETPMLTSESEQRRAAVLHSATTPDMKALLLESMAYDPEELLAFAVHSLDEDAGRLVFTRIIASTWHTTTAEGWQDRWQAALDAGLPPRTAFLAMQAAWIERGFVNTMTEAVLKSAARSGMCEDHVDAAPMWEAAKAMAVKHKLVEAVVLESFRRHVNAAKGHA